jgi:hypothetical protein
VGAGLAILEVAEKVTSQVKVPKLPPLFSAHALLKTSSSLELVGIDQNAGFTVNYPNNEGAGG